MNKKREISQTEADALIDQYLMNKGKNNASTIPTTPNTKSNKDVERVTDSADNSAFDNTISIKNEQQELETIASRGYRAVVDKAEEFGRCARTRKLLSIYNTRNMYTFDFIEYLITLVKFSAIDKIEEHVKNMPYNPNANKDDFMFMAKGLFESLPFNSLEEKKRIKKLLGL